MDDIKMCEVKQELEIEPTVLQPPDVYYPLLSTVKIEPEGEESGRDEPVEQQFVKSESIELNFVRLTQDCYVMIERSPAVLCQECGQTLLNISDLHQHIHNSHEPRAVRDATPAYDGIITAAHRSNSNCVSRRPIQYQCADCEYSASRKHCLILHIRTHTKEKPYKCSQCLYSASQKYALVVHARTHTGEKPEKPFKCSQCSYSASQKNDLVRHTRTHTGEKPYKCSQCLYSASQRNSLVIHTRTHTGEKPYKCSECNYSASHKRNLKLHFRKHTGEKLSK